MWKIGVRVDLKLLVAVAFAASAIVAVLSVESEAGEAAMAQEDELQIALEHIDIAAQYSKAIQENAQGLKDFLSSGAVHLISMDANADALNGVVTHRSGSDPSSPDDSISQMAGMTQSETSVAWCGENAVIGFNDSGSFVRSITTFPPGSFTFNGYAHSDNAGGTFTDMGALRSGVLPAGVRFRDLGGDPVLGCTRESTFYYASLARDIFFFGPPRSGISVSPSYDGGRTFPQARMAVSKLTNHFLDKPWMAVNYSALSASDVIHVTYTDFDNSFATPPCVGTTRVAIEYVRSVDGGLTWSSPITIDQTCGPVNFVQGSQVRVGNGSDVYVAWERYPTGGPNQRQLLIKKSTNGGASFAPLPTLVSSITPVGTSQVLRGRFRTFLDLQGLAIDTSGGGSSGNVYVTWHDGRNLKVFDPFSGCEAQPRYCFGDVLFSRSTDGGATWTAPIRVNEDPPNSPVDQFFPAITVDKNGHLFVLYYDRSRDARNLLTDAFLARSVNDGSSWSNARVTSSNFPPITGFQDVIVNSLYMGDYIGAATDTLMRRSGVILAWGDNSLGDQNVLFVKK